MHIYPATTILAYHWDFRRTAIIKIRSDSYNIHTPLVATEFPFRVWRVINEVHMALPAEVVCSDAKIKKSLMTVNSF